MSYCGRDGAVLEERAEHQPSSELDGLVIDDRYRLVHPVGSGGVGVIYRARHVRIPRDLAIKLLLPEARRNEEAVARFRREVHVQTSLCHPNIVEVLDFGETEETGLYIVMEYLAGETLAERVARDGALGILDVFKIVEQLGSALHFAHERGVVHRDIKAENVFLVAKTGRRDDFDVRLLDFGTAQVTEERPRAGAARSGVTPAGFTLGTPYSMSPEQITNAEVDRRSDIYSFGVLLYELLAGELPFDESSPPGYLRAHLVKRPVPLRSARAARWVPTALAKLVHDMLEKDPARRPQTIVEVLDALDHIRSLVLSRWAETHLACRRRAARLKLHGEREGGAAEAANDPHQRVLVIDDEAATRFLLRQQITRAGYSVTLFEEASRALQWLRTHEPPACVVVDLLMPGTSGFEFLRAMRTQLPELPVIVCSGLESSALLDEARTAGATRVVPKHQLHRLPALLAEALDESRVSA
ncbi:MAG: protein kinase [Myxococcales bacterium]|nr:protein kinase [Myxococcales bacterium]MCB9751305.1 protein kinase [Myxococcales bacterium]